MTTQPAEAAGIHATDFWQPLAMFWVSRIMLGIVFLASYFLLQDARIWLNYNPTAYHSFSLAYLGFGCLAVYLKVLRKSNFIVQLSLLTLMNIGFIILLMYASGDIKNGLGLLLIISIAAASLISQWRLALFYAAIASIGLLLEQSYQMFIWNEDFGDYSHAVMLSISCFATTWLTHSFRKRASLHAKLASQRVIYLENLPQVNQLVTQEMDDGVIVVDQALTLHHRNRQADFLLGIQTNARNNLSLAEYVTELATLLKRWNQHGHGRQHLIKLSLRKRDLRLTGNILHKIRNPLSAISHATQLLQEDEFHDQFYQVEKIPPQGFVLDTDVWERTITFDQRNLQEDTYGTCASTASAIAGNVMAA